MHNTRRGRIQSDMQPAKTKKPIRYGVALTRKQRAQRRKQAAYYTAAFNQLRDNTPAQDDAALETMIAEEAATQEFQPKIEATPIPIEEVVDAELARQQFKTLRPVFEDDGEPKIVVIDRQVDEEQGPVDDVIRSDGWHDLVISDERPLPSVPTEEEKQDAFEDRLAKMPKGMRRMATIMPYFNAQQIAGRILNEMLPPKQRTSTQPLVVHVTASEALRLRQSDEKPCCYCRKPRSPKHAFCSPTCCRLYKENGNRPIEESPGYMAPEPEEEYTPEPPWNLPSAFEEPETLDIQEVSTVEGHPHVE